MESPVWDGGTGQQIPGLKVLVVLASLIVVCSTTTAAVGIVHLRPDPVSGGTAEIDADKQVVVETVAIDYDGAEATGMTVVLNNTGGELTVDVTGELRTRNGTLVASDTSTELVAAGDVVTVSLTFDGTHAQSEWAWHRVTVV